MCARCAGLDIVYECTGPPVTDVKRADYMARCVPAQLTLTFVMIKRRIYC